MQHHSSPRHPAHRWVLGWLKGRLGVAVVLACVVLIAVGIGRAVGGQGTGSTTVQIGSGAQTPVAVPSDEDDGVEGGPTVQPAKPSLAPGSVQPLKVANQFIRAWSRSQLDAKQWHAGLTPYATRALASRLSGVDPAGVPAQRITGNPRLIRQSAGAAAVAVPVDSGTVQLRLVVVGGEWLVDGVDWSRE